MRQSGCWAKRRGRDMRCLVACSGGRFSSRRQGRGGAWSVGLWRFAELGRVALLALGVSSFVHGIWYGSVERGGALETFFGDNFNDHIFERTLTCALLHSD
jgi:hypothetical protein